MQKSTCNIYPERNPPNISWNKNTENKDVHETKVNMKKCFLEKQKNIKCICDKTNKNNRNTHNMFEEQCVQKSQYLSSYYKE